MLRRGLWRGLAALAALTVMLAATPPASAGNGSPFDNSAKPMDIAIIGDVPYGGAAAAAFPGLIEAINRDNKVRVLVHVGDIKSGSTECTDEWFDQIRDDFDEAKDPVVYTIGDNEWTDCHRANNGGYDPLGRLAQIRSTFFADPGSTLGGRTKAVEAQSGFPENQLWYESRVAFATVHEIGSNNGLDPWFDGAETPAQTSARVAEVDARTAANVAWLEHTFAVANERGAAGVVLFAHADLWHPDDRADGADFSQHQPFVETLSALASSFGKPVLLISGDSHDYRVDVGVPWFGLYGVSAPSNLTQIIVDRSIEDDVDWLRLHIDPKTPEVFSWSQEFAG